MTVLSTPNTVQFKDTLGPVATMVWPASGSLRVPFDTHFVLTFNEPVQVGVGNFQVSVNGLVVASIPVNDPDQVSIQGSVVTLRPTTPLAKNTNYTITSPAGLFKDLAGNDWVDTASKGAYTFTTTAASTSAGDTYPPLVDGAVYRSTIAPSASVTIPFTESVVKGSGRIGLFEWNPNTGTLSVEVTTSQSWTNQSLTLKPASALNASKNYVVAIWSNAILDSAGNNFNFGPDKTAPTPVYGLSIKVDDTPPVAPKLLPSSAWTAVTDPWVTFTTSQGEVVFDLDANKAPISTANMLAYVNSGFYDGTLFHRIIDGFMVQGGGFTTGMTYDTPTYGAIVNESTNGLINARGTLAMARTTDPNSATSQFFVNLVDNAFLNRSATTDGYAVFGKVVSGMSVIDAMAKVTTTTVGSSQNVPSIEIFTLSAKQTQAGQWKGSQGLLTLTDLEANATWTYSLDTGKTWSLGQGNALQLPSGYWAPNTVQVQQTDALGNTSTPFKFSGALWVNVPVGAKFWANADQIPTEINKASAVGLTDAIAILKMIVGLNINADGSAASPYQSLAADFDQDGSVGLTDAIGVLKMIVGLTAPTCNSKTR